MGKQMAPVTFSQDMSYFIDDRIEDTNEIIDDGIDAMNQATDVMVEKGTQAMSDTIAHVTKSMVDLTKANFNKLTENSDSLIEKFKGKFDKSSEEHAEGDEELKISSEEGKKSLNGPEQLQEPQFTMAEHTLEVRMSEAGGKNFASLEQKREQQVESAKQVQSQPDDKPKDLGRGAIAQQQLGDKLEEQRALAAQRDREFEDEMMDRQMRRR